MADPRQETTPPPLPEVGARFVHEGQTWVAYAREGDTIWAILSTDPGEVLILNPKEALVHGR